MGEVAEREGYSSGQSGVPEEELAAKVVGTTEEAAKECVSVAVKIFLKRNAETIPVFLSEPILAQAVTVPPEPLAVERAWKQVPLQQGVFFPLHHRSSGAHWEED